APARGAGRLPHPRGARGLDRGSRLAGRPRADDRRRSPRALARAAVVLARGGGAVTAAVLARPVTVARRLSWHGWALGRLLALLALLLVAAAYAGARAIESGRLRTLLLTALLVGLAFNTKMLAAAVVVPGIGLGYLLAAPVSWRRLVGNLAAASALLVVVCGAWVAAVDLTPAADRPYVGSTSDNSALGLALGHNCPG